MIEADAKILASRLRLRPKFWYPGESGVGTLKSLINIDQM